MDIEYNLKMLIQQVKDEAIISLVEKNIPDEKVREQSVAILRAFSRRGVSAETVLDALMELNEEGVL